MNLMTIDPSLTCTGWCLASYTEKPGCLAVHHVGRAKAPASGPLDVRVGALMKSLSAVWFDHSEEWSSQGKVVIELPSSSVSLRHTGGGHGLAVYGYTVGAIHMMFRSLLGENNVIGVDTNWMGSRSKEKLYKIAVKKYPPIARLNDPGHDISDAVALAAWWDEIGQKKLARS